ncbi:MAG: riboflavin biosynthesis protein RibF [Ruminococcus sp.]|nr:riboflavin biosynthesis protein RibF [Ruminococcus sp.]
MTDITENGAGSGVRTAVALGLFDGVHRGHRTVIEKAVSLRAAGLRPTVFSFKTNTVTSKGHDGRFEMILSDKEKLRHFEEAGVELICSPDFESMKDMSGEEFVRRVLIDKLHCAAAVCGSDFRFGRGAKDDVNSLALYGRKYGIDIFTVEKLTWDGEEVSSTAVRKYIRTGHIDRANELLGYTFSLTLSVEHGRELGRTWSFPTINQLIPEGQILPKFGVYCTRVRIGGEIMYGVTNIGVKPTLKAHDAPLAETYILDFSGDLYGQEITILLDRFVRPEQGFESFDALRAQIARDTETVRAYYRQFPEGAQLS